MEKSCVFILKHKGSGEIVPMDKSNIIGPASCEGRAPLDVVYGLAFHGYRREITSCKEQGKDVSVFVLPHSEGHIISQLLTSATADMSGEIALNSQGIRLKKDGVVCGFFSIDRVLYFPFAKLAGETPEPVETQEPTTSEEDSEGGEKEVAEENNKAVFAPTGDELLEQMKGRGLV